MPNPKSIPASKQPPNYHHTPNNNPIYGWQEARVLSLILRYLVQRRFKYVLLRIDMKLSKNYWKLGCLDRLVHRRIQQVFYQLRDMTTRKQLIQNTGKMQRVSLISIITCKIQKTIRNTIQYSFSKINNYHHYTTILHISLQHSIQNSTTLHKSLLQKQAINSIHSKILRYELIEYKFIYIGKFMREKVLGNMRKGFRMVCGQALASKVEEAQSQYRNSRNQVLSVRNNVSEGLLAQRKKMGELKSYTQRVELQKYQKLSENKRQKALYEANQRNTIKQHTTKIYHLKQTQTSSQFNLQNLEDIAQNRQLLRNSSGSALVTHHQLYHQLFAEQLHIGNKFTLIKQKFSEFLRSVPNLQKSTEYQIYRNLKIIGILYQYENIGVEEVPLNYQLAKLQNTQLKQLLKVVIHYQLLINKKQIISVNARQLQDSFDSLFGYLDIGYETSKGGKLDRKQTAKTSIFSIVSER